MRDDCIDIDHTVCALESRVENLLDTFDAFDTNISVLDNIRSIFVQKKDTMLLSLKYDYRTFVSTEVYNTTLGHDTSIPDYDSSTYSSMPKPKTSTQTTFLNKYPINLAPPDHVLSPFEFRNPNTPGIVTRTVDSHKFLKAKLPFKCTGIDTIFTFYNNVRHIASSYNTLLQPLHFVTRSLGTCSITPDNCLGFASVKDAVSTALYLKLASYDYFPEFPQARTYVQAATSNSNGYQLLFRILELVHPQLREAKGGINKSIPIPVYTDVDDDSIYTFLTRYQNYLLYEQLSPEHRVYSKREQTIFLITSLKLDKRFRMGVQYVENSLMAYQRDVITTPTVEFPFDLELDEIGVTIDERSDALPLEHMCLSLFHPFLLLLALASFDN